MDELARYYMYKAKKGLAERIPKLPYKVNEKEYQDRLDYENKIIIQMGYPGYFLVVQDFINWAKNQGILVGPGRGSGAGALACFALGITNIDPIPYGLIFERFLNPARVSMPDLDIDFPKAKRDLVIQYVQDKYGHDKVAQIGTFGTFKAKAAIKAVARTLGHKIIVAEKLTKLWPKPKHGREIKFEEALEDVSKLREWYDSSTPEGEILRWAHKCEGRVASFGIHASGVVISNEPLYETVPLAIGRHGETVTQWDMNCIEDVGLIKFDFLGLKNLDTIQLTMNHIKRRYGLDIDIENLPLDDSKVYSNLRKGDNIGVFQLESSSGMKDLLVKIRPENIEDITALVAMYRPGPLNSNKMPDYLAWRAGLTEPTYHHPSLEPILASTGGWIVYQEQVLQIARDLAGYDLAGADLLRRAVGKKKEKEMAEHLGRFTKGMVDNGYTKDLANTLWSEIKAFADYGFNKSHAFSYAMIAYWCAYLKTYYPTEFMAAALTCDSGNMDQMIVYLQECKRLGIDVLPPDINDSELEFTPLDGQIRFGLTAIKNLREGPGRHILDVRSEGGKFQSIFDFARRIDLGLVNRKKLDSLVLSGAFDFTEQNRSTLLQAIEDILEYKKEQKRYEKKLETFEKKSEAYLGRLAAIERGDRSANGEKLKSLKKPVQPKAPEFPTYMPEAELAKQLILHKEKELTGFFMSGHPLDGFKDKICRTISSLKDDKPEQIIMICLLSELQIKESKKKQRYAFARFEDLTGNVEGVIWPWLYKQCSDQLLLNVPIRIGAKVTYTDAEVDEDSKQDEVIPYLEIKSVELLERPTEDSQNITIEVPLKLSSVKEVKKSLNKHAGKAGVASVRFRLQSDGILAVPRVFGINQNGRAIKTEILRRGK